MKVLEHGQDSLTQVIMPKVLLAEITAYCGAEPDLERCGLLAGRGESATRFFPTRNIAADPAHQFMVDPTDQLASFRAMHEAREEMLGIVHSHPNSPAQPSSTDLALAAYPGIAYLIISLADPITPHACFLYRNAAFQELPLVVI